MTRTTIAAAVAGALLVSPAVIALLPASAAPTEPATGDVVLRTVSPQDDEAFIQGAVLDRAGRYVDGVTVEALGKGGAVEASSITYENPDEDQDHGFYRLYVSPGTYKIRLSSEKGVDQPFRTVVLPGKVKVRDQDVREVKDVVVTLKKPSASRTVATMVTKRVKVGRAVQVKVRVTCEDVAPVVGKALISVDGRKRSIAVLTKRAGGKVVVTVPRGQKPGNHTVQVTFLGSDAVKASKAKPVGFVVTRK